MLLTNFVTEGKCLITIDNPYLDSKFFKFMADASESNSNNMDAAINNANTVNADATVNINHPKINVSVPASALNNLAAAASVAGGGGLALKVMQQVPGGPGIKVVAGAATMVTAQALTIGLGKILNQENSTNNNTKKLLCAKQMLYNSTESNYLLSPTDISINQLCACGGAKQSNSSFTEQLHSISNAQLSEQFNNFPLNLIPEINQLATAELMFLFIILNIFIVKYINTIDFSKYFPKNKLGNLFLKLINRYIMM
jgi:hypothetical protein